jgi:hypothetical protein
MSIHKSATPKMRRTNAKEGVGGGNRDGWSKMSGPVEVEHEIINK